MSETPTQAVPPVIPGNGPTIAGSPWLIEQQQPELEAAPAPTQEKGP